MIIDVTALLKIDDPNTGYNVEPLAPVEIRDSNGNLAIIYSDEAMTNPISQPTNCDANGQFLCYAIDGTYTVKITFSSGAITRTVQANKTGKDISGNLSVAYLDQFRDLLHGRGMLASETPSVLVESQITSSNAAGESVLSVASVGGFVEGAICVIYHSSVQLFESYFITQVAGQNIALRPSLKYSVDSTCTIERGWFNQPHPGKFYMRMLAQKIARGLGKDFSYPESRRIYYTSFDNSNELTAINSASVNYYDANNQGQGTYNLPVEFLTSKVAFIDITTNNDGAETSLIDAADLNDLQLDLCLMSRSESVDIFVSVIDENGREIAKNLIDKSGQTIHKNYKLKIKPPYDTSKFKIRFSCENVSSATALIIDYIDVYESYSNSNDRLITNSQDVTIVGIGDSWMAGDITQPERESILTQLKKELPECNIINAGVGGNTADLILARFDADVTPHKPTHVIVNTGTNDCYSPSSGTFYPNAVDNFNGYMSQIINKIKAIGAKPIIIGVPALSESDASFTNFSLNDRAKTYVKYFDQAKALTIVSSGSSLPTDVSTTKVDFTPTVSIGGSSAGVTFTSNCKYVKIGNVVNFFVNITLTSKGGLTGIVEIGSLPVSSVSGAVHTFNSVVTGGTLTGYGSMAALNIGSQDVFRLITNTQSGVTYIDDTMILDTSSIYFSGSYLN